MNFRGLAGGLLALGMTTLAGCNCPDADVAPVQFTLQFSTDTLGAGRGFRRAELQAAYVVRYKQNGFQGLIDTLHTARGPYNFNEDSLQFYYPGPGLPPQVHLPGHYYDFYEPAALARSFALHIGPDVFRLTDFDTQESTTGLVCPRTHFDHYYVVLNDQRIDVLGGYLLKR
jgi:hypothetical protein